MANQRRWGRVLLVTALALASACSSQDGLTGGGDDCDYLMLPQPGESRSISTVACVNSDLATDMTVNVTFLGPSEEDGGVPGAPGPTPVSQFRIEHVDITYRNLTTNGSVAGVDVPAPIRIPIQDVFDIEDDEELTLLGFPILLSGAKASPPLNSDAFYPTDSGVVFEATLAWWGHPVTDDNAWCYATMRWVFTVIPC